MTTADWKAFDFDAIRREAMQLYDDYNINGVRVAPVMAQDSIEYWIAVATWMRAKPDESTTAVSEPVAGEHQTR